MIKKTATVKGSFASLEDAIQNTASELLAEQRHDCPSHPVRAFLLVLFDADGIHVAEGRVNQ